MTLKRRIEKLESRPRSVAKGRPRVSRKVLRVLLGWTKYGDLPLTPEEESQKEAFAADLEDRTRKHEEQRTKALELLAEGRPHDEISRAVGTNPSMVRRWEVEERWEKEGHGGENRRAHLDSSDLTDEARADAQEGVGSQHAISPVQTLSQTLDLPKSAPQNPKKARAQDVRTEFSPYRRGRPETAYEETMRKLRGMGSRRPELCSVCNDPIGFPRVRKGERLFHQACLEL